MKIKKRFFIIMLLIISVYFYPATVNAFTDQTTSERILRENKHFIHFIDICITNFSAETNKEKFKKAYSKHFNADVAYLQADYKRSFKTVYLSQKELASIYESILKDFYLEDSKNILDKLAPIIIRSKNARARLYLTLGYRDRTVSWTHFTVADASNPRLYSYKLFKYEEAIKMARRAKRYGFLALFESQNKSSKHKIYNQLIKTEKEKGNLFYGRFLGLNEKQIIDEMGKTFEEHEKEGKKEGNGESNNKKDKYFEKKVQKRVRFRNEARLAKFLLNTEFDKAEDIIRNYIDDFNYKIIFATFDVMSTKGKTKTETGETIDSIAAEIDFEKYKIHLMDNYLRLSKGSVLDTFYKDMKVVDYISENKKGKDKDKKNDEKKVEEKKEVEEKKDK